MTGFRYKCCENCSNNPKNNKFASGFCNCMLPDMEREGYFTADGSNIPSNIIITPVTQSQYIITNSSDINTVNTYVVGSGEDE